MLSFFVSVVRVAVPLVPVGPVHKQAHKGATVARLAALTLRKLLVLLFTQRDLDSVNSAVTCRGLCSFASVWGGLIPAARPAFVASSGLGARPIWSFAPRYAVFPSSFMYALPGVSLSITPLNPLTQGFSRMTCRRSFI